MTEAQLVKKIKQLRAVKPRKDWVLLNKNRILGEEQRIEIFPFLKPAYAGLFCLLFLIGIFEFSQDSLPGEKLYFIKKITEKSQMILSSEEEKPRLNLEMVNRRLEELNQIVEGNEIKKLAPALREYKASVSEATKNLTKIMTTTSDPMVLKGIAEQASEIEKNKETLTKVYGIAGLEGEEGINPTKIVVEWLINDLEGRSLNEEDALLFAAAKIEYENGNYAESLVKILDLSQE